MRSATRLCSFILPILALAASADEPDQPAKKSAAELRRVIPGDYVVRNATHAAIQMYGPDRRRVTARIVGDEFVFERFFANGKNRTVRFLIQDFDQHEHGSVYVQVATSKAGVVIHCWDCYIGGFELVRVPPLKKVGKSISDPPSGTRR